MDDRLDRRSTNHGSGGELSPRAQAMNFPEIVASIAENAPPIIEARTCPDQYVGTIRQLARGRGISTRRSARSRSTAPGLLVVLESPHTKEFEGEPAPARGQTGFRIATFLEKSVEQGSLGDEPVILLNAVQYQCSLGQPTHQFRDRIFTAAWARGGRNDFINRLRRLFQPDDLVVCCCTRGANGHPDSHLRQLVYDAIVEVVPERQVLRRTHPASWYKEQHSRRSWTPA